MKLTAGAGCIHADCLVVIKQHNLSTELTTEIKVRVRASSSDITEHIFDRADCAIKGGILNGRRLCGCGGFLSCQG